MTAIKTQRQIKEHPILFSGAMVRAILEGKKTQTRRVIKLPPAPSHLGKWEATTVGGEGVTSQRGEFVPEMPAIWHTRTGACLGCPYGQVGSRLWVRETFTSMNGHTFYRADALPGRENILKYKPSIFMPRWASRISLEITGVRVERLQEISEEDAKAEGIFNGAYHPGLGKGGKPGWCWKPNHFAGTPRHGYELLWDSINGKRESYSWQDNPWCWVIEFRKVEVSR